MVNVDLHKTLEEFTEEFGVFTDIEILKKEMSGLSFYFEDDKNKEFGIMIGWYLEHRLGVGIRDTVDDMANKNIKKALIVADGGMTSGCKDILKNLKIVKKITIDIMTLKESMIFVPDHVLVPQHRICTVKEKKDLFKSYGLKWKSLPHIKSDDIMVKYLGASKSQLIEIIRKSDSDPDLYILTYRIVT
jgi:DNA-directed RNA polymerase subunit H (RpoH/RPB5)